MGLLANAKQPPQTPPDAAMAQESQPQPNQQSGAAPELQQVFNKLEEMVLTYIYSAETDQLIDEGLRSQESPDQGIGMVSARILQKIDGDIKQAGKQVPVQVIFQLGITIVEAVTDIAVESGLVDRQQANSVAQMAFTVALTRIGQESGEQLSPQERQGFQSLIQQFEVLEREYQSQQQQQQVGGQ